jgi:hypothetical protein
MEANLAVRCIDPCRPAIIVFFGVARFPEESALIRTPEKFLFILGLAFPGEC